MPIEGVYEPSPRDFVAEQVAAYEASNGAEANTFRDTGLPIVVVTMRGRASGKVRKVPLMRVEHDGAYALIASRGGAPTHPVWYYNLVATTEAITIQDGAVRRDFAVHEAFDEELATWWARAVAAYPPYGEYQQASPRRFPVFVAEPLARP